MISFFASAPCLHIFFCLSLRSLNPSQKHSQQTLLESLQREDMAEDGTPERLFSDLEGSTNLVKVKRGIRQCLHTLQGLSEASRQVLSPAVWHRLMRGVCNSLAEHLVKEVLAQQEISVQSGKEIWSLLGESLSVFASLLRQRQPVPHQKTPLRSPGLERLGALVEILHPELSLAELGQLWEASRHRAQQVHETPRGIAQTLTREELQRLISALWTESPKRTALLERIKST